MNQLKEDLQQAEGRVCQLEGEKKKLAEQVAYLKKQESASGDDYKAQLQSLLSQKQQA